MQPLPKDDIDCAQMRAVQMYANTVYPDGENRIMAKHCTSFNAIRFVGCRGPKHLMGFAVSKHSSGLFAINAFGSNLIKADKTKCLR